MRGTSKWGDTRISHGLAVVSEVTLAIATTQWDKYQFFTCNNNNNNTKKLRQLYYLVVLHCPGADAKSFHNTMQQGQQDHIYTNQCNWMIPFVPSMPSDHGLEAVVYETTTLCI
jgi:hypothetical protein